MFKTIFANSRRESDKSVRAVVDINEDDIFEHDFSEALSKVKVYTAHDRTRTVDSADFHPFQFVVPVAIKDDKFQADIERKLDILKKEAGVEETEPKSNPVIVKWTSFSDLDPLTIASMTVSTKLTQENASQTDSWQSELTKVVRDMDDVRTKHSCEVAKLTDELKCITQALILSQRENALLKESSTETSNDLVLKFTEQEQRNQKLQIEIEQNKARESVTSKRLKLAESNVLKERAMLLALVEKFEGLESAYKTVRKENIVCRMKLMRVKQLENALSGLPKLTDFTSSYLMTAAEDDAKWTAIVQQIQTMSQPTDWYQEREKLLLNVATLTADNSRVKNLCSQVMSEFEKVAKNAKK